MTPRTMEFRVRFLDHTPLGARSYSHAAAAAMQEIADATEEILAKHDLSRIGIGYGIPRER